MALDGGPDRLVAFEHEMVLGLPDQQQDDEPHQGHQRAPHTREIRTDILGDQELYAAPEHAADQLPPAARP